MPRHPKHKSLGKRGVFGNKFLSQLACLYVKRFVFFSLPLGRKIQLLKRHLGCICLMCVRTQLCDCCGFLGFLKRTIAVRRGSETFVDFVHFVHFSRVV